MFKTIRFRLTLWYVALLALILVAFSSALYLTLARSLYQQVDDELQVNAEQVAGAVNIDQGQINFQNGSAGDAPDASTVRERGYLVQLVDASGRVADTNARLASLPVLPGALAAASAGTSSFDTLTANGHSFRILTQPITENGQYYGALQVGQSLDEVAGTLHQLLLLLAGIVPLTLVLASGGGFWFARRALAPMDHITRTAQRISGEDLSRRLDLNLPDDEVGRLARTFDEMLTRLDAAFQRERAANASHELRTPLTAMRGAIDVTLNRPRPASEYRRVLEDLDGDVSHLTRLADDLLTLSRADAGRLPTQRETVSAAHLLQAAAEMARAQAESKYIALEVHADEALTVCADGDKMRRVLFNVVENAIKFSPAGSRITLSSSRDGERVVLAVADLGVGIPPEHLPHVFERFYRTDEAHLSRIDGAGLGLAIARSLVTAQGGNIEVESVLGHGTTFMIKLPSRENA